MYFTCPLVRDLFLFFLLRQHLERKVKREADKLLAEAEAELARQERIIQEEAARQVQHATVTTTFAKRAKDAAIVASASAEEA